MLQWLEIAMPTSQARIESNRRNAKKSTGPKTPEGKAKSSRNALTHGFTSAHAALDSAEQQHFKPFAEEMTTCLKPRNGLELSLTDHIISCAWRLRRVLRIETAQLRSVHHAPGKLFGESLLEGDNHKKLYTISVHETRIQRAM